MGEPKQHNVVIYGDDYGCGVAPSQLLVNANDQVTFQNLTDGNVTVEFLKGNPLDGDIGDVTPGESGKKTRGVNGSVGSYAYKAFCQSKGVYAQASVPRIIVYPEDDIT